jgi:hypothetical protein
MNMKTLTNMTTMTTVTTMTNMKSISEIGCRSKLFNQMYLLPT